jgi:phage terminase large subunit GpA-like protein
MGRFWRSVRPSNAGLTHTAAPSESDGIKSLLFQRLKRGQSVRFSDTLDGSYFEQLASERLVTRYMRGRPDRHFERIPGRRAETLDALTYALAAREVLGSISTCARKP